MAAKYCLNVGMESTGILVIGCCPKLNICIFLPQFQLLLVALFGELTFWLEEIARARDGYIVGGIEGNYSKFVLDHLQGCLVGRVVFSFPSKVKFLDLVNFFSYFCLVITLACWIFSLHLLKERKGERKRKRFPLLIMLVALLVLLQRLILIFRHGSMM